MYNQQRKKTNFRKTDAEDTDTTKTDTKESFEIDEAARIPTQHGNVYDLIFNWRGKMYSIKCSSLKYLNHKRQKYRML